MQCPVIVLMSSHYYLPITSELFDIESNMFTGDGWSFLPAWGQIEEFYLPNNLITATIPTEIGRLTTLRILEMSGTETSGTIPTEIGNLAMLTSFSSDQSDLQGSIPTEIGRLTNLENFFLRGAQLQGTTIPTEIGQCTNLGKRYIGFCHDVFVCTSVCCSCSSLSHHSSSSVYSTLLQLLGGYSTE